MRTPRLGIDPTLEPALCIARSALVFRVLVLPVLALGLIAGSANAFVPAPDQAALEIPLPYSQENLAYGEEVALAASPEVSASIAGQIGGRWSVHSWNRRSGSPHYVVGSGADVAPALAGRSDAESAALHVLRQNANALRLQPEQLRLDVVTEGVGKMSAHFQQTYDGLDVIGGRAHATFMNTGRVFVMGSDFYAIDNLSVTPSISKAHAERIAIDDLPHEQRSVSSEVGEETGVYVLPYPTSRDSFDPRLVWKVTVETDGRTGVFHTYLDAHSGEILWRYNDVHFSNFVGTTEGNVEHTTWCNTETLQGLGRMEVVVTGVGTAISFWDGFWDLPNGNETPRTATNRFFGPNVDVNRASGQGSDASQSATITPGESFTFNWSDANSRQDERDVFDAVIDMAFFFEGMDPDFAFSNTRITANVGVAGSCNAFWNGSINFYNAGGSCANTGEIQGVVHHEYGHGVQNHLIGGQGDEGLGEGNGDILANFMTDEAVIGRGFFVGNCSGGIRTSNNTLQYPEDLTGEVHDDGRIIAGVMWNARTNLQNSLGATAGKAQAAVIWHYGRKLERPTNQPDQCLSMFIADDDNGNVFDGTPNFDALCAAVQAHDTDGDAFDCPEAGTVWVDFDYVGTENGTQARPYNSLLQAHSAAPVDYIMKVRDGTTPEVGTLSKRGVIRAIGGVVRVGAP